MMNEGCPALNDYKLWIDANRNSPRTTFLVDEGLMAAADLHAKYLRDNNLRGHNGPYGMTPPQRKFWERIQIWDNWASAVAENQGNIKAPFSWRAKDIVRAMNVDDGVLSRGHRNNQARTDFDTIGVGIAFSADGKEAWTVWLFANTNTCCPQANCDFSAQTRTDLGLDAFAASEIAPYC
jgi:hypothetical protein